MPLRPQPGTEVIEQRFQQAGERGLVRGGQACHKVGLAAEYQVYQPLDQGVPRGQEGDDDRP